MAAPTNGPTDTNGLIPSEWPAQAADVIVENIGKVRDKTTKPAITAARALVYGLIAAIVGVVTLVLLLVFIARLYDNYVPGNIWPLYAALAVLMIGLGLVALKKANAPAPAGN